MWGLRRRSRGRHAATGRTGGTPLRPGVPPPSVALLATPPPVPEPAVPPPAPATPPPSGPRVELGFADGSVLALPPTSADAAALLRVADTLRGSLDRPLGSSRADGCR